MRRVSLVLATTLLACASPRSATPPDDTPPPGGDDPSDATPLDDGMPETTPDAGVDIGTVPPQSCGQVIDVNALFAERVGWGRTTTGGDPSNVYVVTTLSGGSSGTGNQGSLRRALESNEDFWIVFAVDGTIRLDPERVDVRSNKTIDGRGRTIRIDGSLRMSSVRNILVTDVTLSNEAHLDECGQSGDVVAISGPGGAEPGDYPARRFWFHHVDFQRGGDGLLDLRGATDITISWSHFHDHSKGMLMWKDSDNQASPGMRVTMHHNYLDRMTVRGPRFHYGKLHYFNNYVFHWYDYGAGCMDSAQCLLQRNVFEARDTCAPLAIVLGQCNDPAPCGDADGGSPKTAVVTDDGDAPGFTRDLENLLLNGAQIAVNQSAMVFTDPGYPFAAEAATTELAQRIRDHVGPRTTMCQ